MLPAARFSQPRPSVLEEVSETRAVRMKRSGDPGWPAL